MTTRVYIEDLADMGFPLKDFWTTNDHVILFPVSCTVSYRFYNKLISKSFKCILSEYMTMVSVEIIGSPLNTFDKIVEVLNQEKEKYNI
ncbi:MAG: hypothetical protein LBB45_08720 [Methanobrevibacter sp.]|jgi:hypothetical protein|nr:hypothetical protein [Candidatus Methanovirga basalitermitum]